MMKEISLAASFILIEKIEQRQKVQTRREEDYNSCCPLYATKSGGENCKN